MSEADSMSAYAVSVSVMEAGRVCEVFSARCCGLYSLLLVKSVLGS